MSEDKRITTCEIMRCTYWDGVKCTDPDEYHDEQGAAICRFNDRAVSYITKESKDEIRIQVIDEITRNLDKEILRVKSLDKTRVDPEWCGSYISGLVSAKDIIKRGLL